MSDQKSVNFTLSIDEPAPDKATFEDSLRKTVLTGPAALRTALLLSIEKVMTGKMSVPQANAVVGLSGEVHKSIRQEYDMIVYAMENLGMVQKTNVLAYDDEETLDRESGIQDQRD